MRLSVLSVCVCVHGCAHSFLLRSLYYKHEENTFHQSSCCVCYLCKSPGVFWQQSRGSSRWENCSTPALLLLREKPALAILSCKINLKAEIPAGHLSAQHSLIWPHRTHLSPFSPQKESGIFIMTVSWGILVKEVSGFLTLAICSIALL